MAGHATQAALLSDTGADVRVSQPGAPPIALYDARVPSEADRSELARLEAKQPAGARAMRAQAEAFAGLLRQELHSIAGGEAPTSVLLLADLAVSAMVSVQMQRFMTFGAFGRWTEAHLDGGDDTTQREKAEKSQRNLAGISVIARDMLLAARAAARDAGNANRGSATDQLFNAIGVGGAEVQTHSPFDGGGGEQKGPCAPPSPAPSVFSKGPE